MIHRVHLLKRNCSEFFVNTYVEHSPLTYVKFAVNRLNTLLRRLTRIAAPALTLCCANYSSDVKNLRFLCHLLQFHYPKIPLHVNENLLVI